MVRKVCPICDQVMTSAHYCKNCRSFIRHPYIRETDYYLNERHPVFEDHCDFHNSWEEEKNQRDQKPVVNKPPKRAVNPNVYGSARDVSEQARRVAAMARGEVAKTAKTWSDSVSAGKTQTIMNGKVIKTQTDGKRAVTTSGRKKGTEIPLPLILFVVIILLNTCGRIF